MSQFRVFDAVLGAAQCVSYQMCSTVFVQWLLLHAGSAWMSRIRKSEEKKREIEIIDKS